MRYVSRKRGCFAGRSSGHDGGRNAGWTGTKARSRDEGRDLPNGRVDGARGEHLVSRVPKEPKTCPLPPVGRNLITRKWLDPVELRRVRI